MNQSGMRRDPRLPLTDPPSLAERIRLENGRLHAEREARRAPASEPLPFAGLDTVAEFASRAGISAPSVLRFVTRLGFGGFPDFQKHLREELEAQLLSPLAKAAPPTKARAPRRSPPSPKR